MNRNWSKAQFSDRIQVSAMPTITAQPVLIWV